MSVKSNRRRMITAKAREILKEAVHDLNEVRKLSVRYDTRPLTIEAAYVDVQKAFDAFKLRVKVGRYGIVG